MGKTTVKRKPPVAIGDRRVREQVAQHLRLHPFFHVPTDMPKKLALLLKQLAQISNRDTTLSRPRTGYANPPRLSARLIRRRISPASIGSPSLWLPTVRQADPRELLRCVRHDVLIRSNHQALLTGHIHGYAIAIGRHEAHALASRGCLLPLHGHLGPALGTTSPRSQLAAGPLCQHQERGSCAVRNRQAAPLREPTCARTPGLGTVLPGTDIAAKQ